MTPERERSHALASLQIDQGLSQSDALAQIAEIETANPNHWQELSDQSDPVADYNLGGLAQTLAELPQAEQQAAIDQHALARGYEPTEFRELIGGQDIGISLHTMAQEMRSGTSWEDFQEKARGRGAVGLLDQDKRTAARQSIRNLAEADPEERQEIMSQLDQAVDSGLIEDEMTGLAAFALPEGLDPEYQLMTARTRIFLSGEEDEEQVVAQQGEIGFDSSVEYLDTLFQDQAYVDLVNKWSPQVNGAQEFVRERLERMTENMLQSGQDVTDQQMRDMQAQAIREVAMLKTVNRWSGPAFLPIEMLQVQSDGGFAPSATEIYESDTFFGRLKTALQPRIEVVGLTNIGGPDNSRVVTRLQGAPEFVLDIADIPQAAVTGIGRAVWDEDARARFKAVAEGEGVMTAVGDAITQGVGQRANLFEEALKTDFATEAMDDLARAENNTDFAVAFAKTSVPVLAGFATAVLFPDLFGGLAWVAKGPAKLRLLRHTTEADGAMADSSANLIAGLSNIDDVGPGYQALDKAHDIEKTLIDSIGAEEGEAFGIVRRQLDTAQSELLSIATEEGLFKPITDADLAEIPDEILGPVGDLLIGMAPSARRAKGAEDAGVQRISDVHDYGEQLRTLDRLNEDVLRKGGVDDIKAKTKRDLEGRRVSEAGLKDDALKAAKAKNAKIAAKIEELAEWTVTDEKFKGFVDRARESVKIAIQTRAAATLMTRQSMREAAGVEARIIAAAKSRMGSGATKLQVRLEDLKQIQEKVINARKLGSAARSTDYSDAMRRTMEYARNVSPEARALVRRMIDVGAIRREDGVAVGKLYDQRAIAYSRKNNTTVARYWKERITELFEKIEAKRGDAATRAGGEDVRRLPTQDIRRVDPEALNPEQVQKLTAANKALSDKGLSHQELVIVGFVGKLADRKPLYALREIGSTKVWGKAQDVYDDPDLLITEYEAAQSKVNSVPTPQGQGQLKGARKKVKPRKSKKAETAEAGLTGETGIDSEEEVTDAVIDAARRAAESTAPETSTTPTAVDVSIPDVSNIENVADVNTAFIDWVGVWNEANPAQKVKNPKPHTRAIRAAGKDGNIEAARAKFTEIVNKITKTEDATTAVPPVVKEVVDNANAGPATSGLLADLATLATDIKNKKIKGSNTRANATILNKDVAADLAENAENLLIKTVMGAVKDKVDGSFFVRVKDAFIPKDAPDQFIGAEKVSQIPLQLRNFVKTGGRFETLKLDTIKKVAESLSNSPLKTKWEAIAASGKTEVRLDLIIAARRTRKPDIVDNLLKEFESKALLEREPQIKGVAALHQKKNDILVSASHLNESIVAHELLHAATHRALRSGKHQDVVNDLTFLQNNLIKQKLRAMAANGELTSALINFQKALEGQSPSQVDELIAYAFTDAEVQDFLKTVDVPTFTIGKDSFKVQQRTTRISAAIAQFNNAFEVVIGSIRKLVGLDDTAETTTALEAIIGLTGKIILDDGSTAADAAKARDFDILSATKLSPELDGFLTNLRQLWRRGERDLARSLVDGLEDTQLKDSFEGWTGVWSQIESTIRFIEDASESQRLKVLNDIYNLVVEADKLLPGTLRDFLSFNPLYRKTSPTTTLFDDVSILIEEQLPVWIDEMLEGDISDFIVTRLAYSRDAQRIGFEFDLVDTELQSSILDSNKPFDTFSPSMGGAHEAALKDMNLTDIIEDKLRELHPSGFDVEVVLPAEVTEDTAGAVIVRLIPRATDDNILGATALNLMPGRSPELQSAFRSVEMAGDDYTSIIHILNLHRDAKILSPEDMGTLFSETLLPIMDVPADLTKPKLSYELQRRYVELINEIDDPTIVTRLMSEVMPEFVRREKENVQKVFASLPKWDKHLDTVLAWFKGEAPEDAVEFDVFDVNTLKDLDVSREELIKLLSQPNAQDNIRVSKLRLKGADAWVSLHHGGVLKNIDDRSFIFSSNTRFGLTELHGELVAALNMNALRGLGKSDQARQINEDAIRELVPLINSYVDRLKPLAAKQKELKDFISNLSPDGSTDLVFFQHHPDYLHNLYQARHEIGSQDGFSLMYGDVAPVAYHNYGDDFIDSLPFSRPTDALKQTVKKADGTEKEIAEIEFGEDGRALITVLNRAGSADGADISTVVHELGHVLRRDLTGTQKENLLAWFKKKSTDYENLEIENGRFVGDPGVVDAAEELFAESFQKHLTEAATDTPVIQRVFRNMQKDLQRLLRGSDAEDVEELRPIFENLIGGRDYWTDPDPTVGRFFNDLVQRAKALVAKKPTVTESSAAGYVFREANQAELDIVRIGKDGKEEILTSADDVNDAWANGASIKFKKGDSDATSSPLDIAPDEITISPASARVITQKLLENLRTRARKKKPVAVTSVEQASVGEDIVQQMRVSLAGQSVSRKIAQGTLSLFVGGDPHQMLGLTKLPETTRNAVLAGTRLIEHAFGEITRLITDNEWDTAYKFLSGEVVDFKSVGRSERIKGVGGGRQSMSSGYNSMSTAATALNRWINTKQDDFVAALDELSRNLKAGTFESIDPRVLKQIQRSVTTDPTAPDFLKRMAKALKEDGALNKDGFKVINEILSTMRNADLKPSETKKWSELAKKMFNAINDSSSAVGPTSKTRLAVILTGYGNLQRAVGTWGGMGLMQSTEHIKSFEKYLNGEMLNADELVDAEEMSHLFGMNKDFVSAAGLFADGERLMVPEAAMKKIDEALKRGDISAGKWAIGSTVSELPGYSGVFIRTMKKRMTRGAYVLRQRYFLMNTLDHFLQLAGTPGVGFRTATASTARMMLQNIMVLPGAGFASLLNKNPEAIRSSLQKHGDKVAQFLSQSKWRIDVNDVLKGTDGNIVIAGNVYSFQDIRQLAIEEGIFSSFDTSELAAEIGNQLNEYRRASDNAGLPSRAVQRVHDAHNALSRNLDDIAEAWGERERLGAMITLMEKGIPPRRAARLTIDALFDYAGSMSRGDRHFLLSLLIPFWAFQKNANQQFIRRALSPEGAYKMGVLRRGMEYGAGAVESMWFGATYDAYGVDVRSMSEDERNKYMYLRKTIEYGYGPIYGLPPSMQGTLLGILGVSSLEQLEEQVANDEELADKLYQLENGYGGIANVPDSVIQGIRMALTRPGAGGGAYAGFEEGEAYAARSAQLGSVLQGMSLVTEEGQLQNLTEFVGPTIDPAGRAGFRRHRVGITVPPKMTESLRTHLRIYRTLNNGEVPYEEILIPEPAIYAGLNHVVYLTATFANLFGEIYGKAPFTGDEDDISLPIATVMSNSFSEVVDVGRAPIPGVILSSIGVSNEEGIPRRISPMLMPAMKKAFPQVDFIETRQLYDLYAQNEEEQAQMIQETATLLGISEDEAKKILTGKETRYYTPPGALSFAVENFPMFGEVNRRMLDMPQVLDAVGIIDAPGSRDPLEVAMGNTGRVLEIARFATGVETSRVSRHQQARREDVRFPSSTVEPPADY